LWPETIQVGLFPGHCWLKRGKAIHTINIADDAGPDDLLAALDRLLCMPGRRYGRRTAVELLLSDSVGYAITIPWQSNLSRAAQLNSYGAACLARKGFADDGDWVIEAGFRWPGGHGIALAVRNDWLERLVTITSNVGVRAVSALPACAAAYWYQPLPPKRGPSLLLLEECNRITALRCDAGKVHHIDAEPVVMDAEVSMRRLIARQLGVQPSIAHVDIWCVRNKKAELGLLKAHFAEITFASTVLSGWGAS
jgi:hypothetical protein